MLSGGPELTTGHDDEGQTGEVIEEEDDEQQRPNGRVA
jgi:hypothetical protein